MSERLILQDLVDLLANEKNLTKKDAEAFLRELLSLIAETIETADSVKIKDFGTFKLVKVNSRKSVDVNTGAEIEIPAHYKLSFSPDKILKDKVNTPFAHFESVVLEEGVSFEDTRESVFINDDNNKVESVLSDEIPDSTEIDESDDSVDENASVVKSIVESGMLNKLAEKQEQNTDNIKDEIVEPAKETNNKTIVTEEHLDVTATNQDAVQKINTITENNKDKIADNIVESDIQPEVKKTNIKLTIDDSFISKPDPEPETVQEPIESSITKPVIEDKTEENGVVWTKEDKSGRRNLIIGIIAVAVIVLAILAWRFQSDISGLFDHGNKRPALDLTTNTQQDDVIPVVADTLKKDDKTEINPEIENGNESDSVKTSIDSSANDKPLKVIIGRGETMRSLGEKYFGLRPFWVYIYEENKDKIQNPNNVPHGIEIVIPPASKYGINKYDPESVEKAKKMEAKLFSKF